MKVTFDVVCETGFAGSNHTDTIEMEVPDDISETDLEKAIDEETTSWATNLVSWGYSNIQKSKQ